MTSLAASPARAAVHAPARTRRGPACVASSSSDGSRNQSLPKGRGAPVSGLRNPASAAASRRTRSTRASAVGDDDGMASDIAAAVEAVAEDTVAGEDADAFMNLARERAKRVLLDAVDGTYRGCEASSAERAAVEEAWPV